MPRPRSNTFYLNIPDVASLSLAAKATLSAPPPSRSLSNSASARSTRRASSTSSSSHDADDERDGPRVLLPPPTARKLASPLRLSPQPRTALPAVVLTLNNSSSQWSPKAPSPLRGPASKPSPALLPLKMSALPSASTTTSPDGDSNRDMVYHPVSRKRTTIYQHVLKSSFYAGPSGLMARQFGVRAAWTVDEDIRRALDPKSAPSPWFEDDEDDQVIFLQEARIARAQLARPCNAATRSAPPKSSNHRDNLSSSDEEDDDDDSCSSGSDGPEEYGSSGFFDSSSEEELEEEGMWEMVSA